MYIKNFNTYLQHCVLTEGNLFYNSGGLTKGVPATTRLGRKRKYANKKFQFATLRIFLFLAP